MAVTVPSVKRIAMIGGFAYQTGPAAELNTCLQALADASAGLDYKNSCRIATAAALPAYARVANVITASANGALNGDPSVDGVTLVVGDRVLLKNGAAGADNGIYTVTALGGASAKWKLTRATDANTSAQVTSGMYTEIEEGTANAGTGWLLSTANPITLNTTALTFTQYSGAINRVAGTIAAVGTQAAGTSNKTAAADHVHAHGNQASDGNMHAVAVAAGAAGFLSGADKAKIDALLGIALDATIPTPRLFPAGTDLTDASVHKCTRKSKIARVTIFPTDTWTIGAGETSVWELKNATTAKSLATKTFADAPPTAGTGVDMTLNVTPTDLVCNAGDVLTLTVTNSAAAQVNGCPLQIVGNYEA